MKERIIIKRLDKVLYQGKILNLPIKEKYIIKKSIEIFGDEDPCIIHMSFIIKEFVTTLLMLFKNNNTKLIYAKNYLKELSFINLEDLSTITIELEGRHK